MRRTYWMMLSFGLMVLAIGAEVPAQDRPQKSQADEARKILEELGGRQALDDKDIEAARRLLEKLIQEKRNQDQAGEKKTEGQPKILIQKKIVEVNKSLEGKIDLLLKEMSEMRKDINDLKRKMESQSPGRNYWEKYSPYFPGKDVKEKKSAAGTPAPGGGTIEIEIVGSDMADLKKLADLLRKMHADEEAKATKKAASPDRAELERRLERILEETEALRREILKKKTK